MCRITLRSWVVAWQRPIPKRQQARGPVVPSVAAGRLTNRCSGRPGIKCSAAGGRAKSAHERWRARVLRWRRAAAELNR
jgi:hypothetical protein